MIEERVVVPRLTSATGMRWVAATAVAVVGVLAYLAVTRPDDRWAAAVVAAVAAVGAAWVASRRVWIEPATGTVVREAFWCLRRRVPLRRAKVRLVGDRHGGLHLAIEQRRTVLLPVVLNTAHVRRVQEPEILRLLAQQIIRHAPHARPVATRLRDLDATRARLGTLTR